MYRFLIPVILALTATAYSIDERTFTPPSQLSAASEAQIRFAIENKYDDTGPGAAQPEYAYNTYKTLEEALIAYLDDPDTKLPEHERAKAIHGLVKPTTPASYTKPLQRYYPKSVEEYTGYKPPSEVNPTTYPKYSFPDKQVIYHEPSKVRIVADTRGLEGNYISNGLQNEYRVEPFKFQRYQSVRGSPLNLAHYSRDPDLQAVHDQFDPHPKYTYTYGVHDKGTGDSKTAHETRTGGTVHGFYSFTDADGKQRTVQYTADDDKGFRATVERTHA